MGLFSFVKSAGEKLLGRTPLDEGAIRQHILSTGLALNPFTVVADPTTGKVTLVGYAEEMADKEKANITAGNII
jgi:hypothetical protein